jgi:hypothetical protein
VSAEFCRYTQASSLTLARFENSSVLSSANPTLATLLLCKNGKQPLSRGKRL